MDLNWGALPIHSNVGTLKLPHGYVAKFAGLPCHMRKMAVHARIWRSEEHSNLLDADLRCNANHRRRGNARVLPLAEHAAVHVLKKDEVFKFEERAFVFCTMHRRSKDTLHRIVFELRLLG